MIPAQGLRFMEDVEPPGPAADDEEDRDRAAPKVFVRTLSAPPALPWEQARVADLEARHGSPLPIAEVVYQLRRLGGWRPGAAARFAAFYVLARDVQGRLDADAEVDGRTLSVTFVTGGARVAKAGRAALRGVAIAALGLFLVATVGIALNRRGELQASAQLLEQHVAGKTKRIAALQRREDVDRLLALQLDRGAPLQDVLADLAWLSNAKTSDARIEAVHWEPGLMAVQIRGDEAPLEPVADRRVRRADRPVRRGVWLWGVTEARPSAPVGRPAAAEFGP